MTAGRSASLFSGEAIIGWAPDAPMSTVTRPTERVVIPSILTVIALGMTIPSVWPITSLGTVSHDAIDADLFLWGFWWTNHAASELRSPYWTGMLLYPNGTSLAFSSFPLPYNLVSI